MLIWSEHLSPYCGAYGLWRGNATTWNECLLMSLVTQALYPAAASIQSTFAGIYLMCSQFHPEIPLSPQVVLRTSRPWY